jgi:hypothetical protein
MDHAWSCWMCGHEENLWGNEGNLSSSVRLLIKWHYLIEELDSVHNEFGKGDGREEGNNFTTMILNETQLSNQAIHKKFICFIAKNVSFLGGWFGIYVQLTDEHSPSMINCCTLWLTAQIWQCKLCRITIVKRLEKPIASIYSYLNALPKHTLDFPKLALCLEPKGNKILYNITTRWISMFGPTKRVLEKFKVLVTKLAINSSRELVTKKTL